MILVDDRPTNGRYGWDWYHMATDDLSDDSLAELHAMADRLGLQRRWVHYHPGIPHYDVPEEKKLEALSLGALEVTTRELVRRCRRLNGRDSRGTGSGLAQSSQ